VTFFGFRFDPRYTRWLALLGIVPSRAFVGVGDGTLEARFGRWYCATPLDNVAGAELTGPYQWFKVIGPHLSFADRGLTFGTNSERGVCIRFREPVPGLEPTGRLRHPGLTVTVEDVEGLISALSTNTA
jgi:hypothetical protein